MVKNPRIGPRGSEGVWQTQPHQPGGSPLRKHLGHNPTETTGGETLLNGHDAPGFTRRREASPTPSIGL